MLAWACARVTPGFSLPMTRSTIIPRGACAGLMRIGREDVGVDDRRPERSPA